jgi:nitrogen fixation/metabolism regulation signal transduction histidine kinase
MILITRKTLKPLKIIEEQMGTISLEGTNEPIDFKGNDEIGALVQQYNDMCQQLEIAANKLARNERENAWREMARQVAHEIKNPLTPMRLNIEYLQMLWDRKDPNFETNFKETLNSLLEQIETLSRIATAFSNYAKLPENNPTTFDLSELLKSTIKLYDVEKNISISLTYNENEDWQLYADRNNLGRVFGNIIKNAIQAIGSEEGRIELTLNRLGERYKINISDNGCGIKEEDQAKIFFPNFTTKSSGMGVGLSVSQNIVQAIGGNITFSSKVGIGTVFTIDIPILKEM